MSLIRIDEVIKNIMLGPRFRDCEYDVLLQFGIRGVRELMEEAGLPKTVRLILDDKFTAPLPVDFIDYCKIARIDPSSREYCTLSINSKMDITQPVATEECGDNQEEVPGGTTKKEGYWFHNFWDQNLGYQGRLFGLGAGRNPRGEYKIDRKRWQIQFSSIVGGDIILEYIANGLDLANGELMVDARSSEALIAWIENLICHYDPKVGPHERARMQKAYINAKNKYRNRNYSFTFDELKEGVNHAYTQAPRA